MFDITTQAVTETVAVHLKDAGGEPLYADAERKLPVRIHVYGPGSAAHGVIESRQTQRAVKRMQDNDNKPRAATFEETVKETAEDLADLTVRFENFSYPPAGDAEGKPLFAAVYSDKRLGFIVKQLSTVLNDWGKFKPGSTAS